MSTNYSLYSIPVLIALPKLKISIAEHKQAAWIISIIPHLYASTIAVRRSAPPHLRDANEGKS